MTERFEKLEVELLSMQPRAVREEVVREIESALDLPLKWPARRGWGDRCLVGAMSVGSLAACVIVAMVILQAPSTSPVTSPAAIATSAPRAGDVSMMLARADSPWAERLK